MRTEQVVLSSSDPRYDIGTVAYLRIQEAELVQRTHTETGLSALRTPSLLAEDMQELYDLLESHNGKNNGEAVSLEHARDPDIVFAEPQANAGSAGPWLTVGNLISRRASPAEQAEECFLTLKGKGRKRTRLLRTGDY